MHLPLDPGNDRPSFPAISLRVPRRMRQRHEPLPATAAMLTNVVLHDRAPAGESVLVTKTLEDALRRVPLLRIAAASAPPYRHARTITTATSVPPSQALITRTGEGSECLHGGRSVDCVHRPLPQAGRFHGLTERIHTDTGMTDQLPTGVRRNARNFESIRLRYDYCTKRRTITHSNAPSRLAPAGARHVRRFVSGCGLHRQTARVSV